MQITYTTTLEDYVALNHHVARKSTAMRTNYLLGWLVLPAIAVLGFAMVALVENYWPVVLIFAAIGLLYAIAYPLTYGPWLDFRIKAYAKGMDTRGVIGQITLILTEESLVEITETTRSEVRWGNVKKVEVAGDYTFIYVTGLAVAILPRYGFDCDEDYDAAREFALARVVGTS